MRASRSMTITEADVNAAQKAWCDALITIGQVYSEGGDHKAVADRLIDDLYDYKDGRRQPKADSWFFGWTASPT